MNRSFIEFKYDEKHNMIGVIYKDNLRKTIKNRRNLKELFRICNRYGYDPYYDKIIVEYADRIIRRYDSYIDNKKNTKVTNKFPSKILSGKSRNIVMSAALIAALIAGGSSLQNGFLDEHDDYLSMNSDTYSSSDYIDEEYEDSLEVNGNKYYISDNNNELDEMFNDDCFHFSYEDRSKSENIRNCLDYEDIFNKYSEQYGIDKKILIAIASQESSGDHYNHLSDDIPASGIMQVEKSVWVGENISTYNFNTNEVETVHITKEQLEDVDFNIKVGTMIFRNYLEQNNYNIPLTVQTYNVGPGDILNVINSCSDNTDKTNDSIIDDSSNNDWLNYRGALNGGDNMYLEHVFSYLKNNQCLTVLKRDGTNININIVNDKQLNKSM